MRMRMMSTLFLASAAGLLSSGLHADVLEVAADGSQEYLTIQTAIDGLSGCPWTQQAKTLQLFYLASEKHAT